MLDNDPFKLGGPSQLPRFYMDQLTGYRYQLASLHYYREITQPPSQIGHGVYAGVSPESGRIRDPFLLDDSWEWIYAGSVFWGADTLLGKVVLSFGFNDLHRQSFYLTIGPRF